MKRVRLLQGIVTYRLCTDHNMVTHFIRLADRIPLFADTHYLHNSCCDTWFCVPSEQRCIMPQQNNSHSKKQFYPPSDTDVDRYAEAVCRELSQISEGFDFDHQTVRGLARFLKTVGSLEANRRNSSSHTDIEK